MKVLSVAERSRIFALLASASLAISAHAYDTGIISGLPDQIQTLMNSTSQSESQLMMLQLQSRSQPGTSSGLSVFKNFYQKQVDNGHAQFTKDLALLQSTLGQLDNEITDDFEKCSYLQKIENSSNDSWDDYTSALTKLGNIRAEFANSNKSSISPMGFSLGGTTQTISSSVSAPYNTVAQALDPKGLLFRIVKNCCQASEHPASGTALCSPHALDAKLEPLDKLKAINARYVDPLNPMMDAQFHLTSSDLMALASVGKLGQFTQATDFDSQYVAMMNLSSACDQAKTDTVNSVLTNAQSIGLIQNLANTFHCSAWALVANDSRTIRQATLAMTDTTMQLPTMTSQCSASIQAQAAASLTFTMPQFNQDVGRYFTLPANIAYSAPVSNPYSVNNFGTEGLSISMMGQGGNTVGSIYMPGINSLSYQSMFNTTSNGLPVVASQAPSMSIRGLASDQPGSPAVSNLSNSMLDLMSVPRGSSVVDNVSGQSAVARVAVQNVSSKILNGDAESARVLSNSLSAKTSDLSDRVSQMASDSGAQSRNVARAKTSQALVEQFTQTDAVLNTASSFNDMNTALAKEVGLHPVSVKTREITTVGSTTSTVTGNGISGSTTVSNLGTDTNPLTQVQTTAAQQQQAITNAMNQVSTMAAGLTPIYTQLQNLINQKNQAIQNFYTDMDPAKAFAQLSNDGASTRIKDEAVIASEYSKDVTAIDVLNTQVIGLESTLQLAQSSMSNYIRAAQAFSGLQVITSGTNPLNPVVGSNPFITPANPLLTNPTTSLPSALTPPSFSLPTLGTPTVNVFWKFFDELMPTAYASVNRQQALKEAFSTYIKSYDAYVQRLKDDRFNLQKKMWAQYIRHERESREEHILPLRYRNELIAFSQTLDAEIPDLRAARQQKTLSASNPQIYNYIADIENDANEMRELLAKEALYAWKAKSPDPMKNGDEWAGMLPAMALQPQN